MKIFLIDDAPHSSAAYLAEMLQAFGACFCERALLQRALSAAVAGEDVLVLPARTSSRGVEEFLERGGSVISILPDENLETRAGLEARGAASTPARLRFVEAVCHGTRGEALWTLGARRLYEPPSRDEKCKPIAFGFQSEDETPDGIGIAEYAVGAGRLVIYAYDIAQCVLRLRQGFPERADFLPPEQQTPRAAFLQWPHPPADTFWRPTADLHAHAFCEIACGLLAGSTPIPTLWHLPHGAPSLLLFSGDEDAAPKADDEIETRDLEARGAAMNLYLFPENTTLSREDLEEYLRRGHTVSAHPFLSDTAGQTPAIQIEKARQQVMAFRGKFGWPVNTIRNHSYMWPGYVELPELWQELGIGMDCNTTSMMRGDSRDWGPFAKLHAAMPLRFAREDGTLIDVFQQPTQLNDDLMFHPSSVKSLKYSLGESTAIFERVLSDATQIHHAPICVNFHPGNYVEFSGEPARALLSLAAEIGLKVWTIDRWHDFWRTRSSWSLQSLQRNGAQLKIELAGAPCEGLTLTLPAAFQNRKLREVFVNGESAESVCARRFGRAVALVELPKTERAALCAEYSQGEENA